MSWFRRTSSRRPYIADNTTWTCKACGVQAWVEGDKNGCGCPENGHARPLVADNPKHWSNQRGFDEGEFEVGGGDWAFTQSAADPRDQLVTVMQEQVAVMNDVIATQSKITSAARHLMQVLAQRSANGLPIFKINSDHDDASIEIIRHAILDLQALLDGTEPPQFCLPERTH